MATSKNTGFDREGATRAQQGISEALLRSEIGFWRELIESSQQTETPESIERMRYALALAESRLAGNPSNVYYMDQAREARK